LTDILHNTDFFGYYRLNLYEAQCPVSWGDAFPMCGNRACAVDTLDEVFFSPLQMTVTNFVCLGRNSGNMESVKSG
jgi:hypothetical protein